MLHEIKPNANSHTSFLVTEKAAADVGLKVNEGKTETSFRTKVRQTHQNISIGNHKPTQLCEEDPH